MACTRCGNKKYKGLFPYCEECQICSNCQGSRFDIKTRRTCKKCSGRGYLIVGSNRKIAV